MISKPALIQSPLLLQFKEIKHGISTKLGGNDKPPFFNNLSYRVGDDTNIVTSNRKKFFSSLDIEVKQLAVPQQIHSLSVLAIGNPGTYPDTDALITNSKNIYLIISVADCYPILIFDNINLIVAAVHSGWRGTQKQILSHTLIKLINEFGCKPESLYVFIGPGICQEHFEVGEEVAGLFDKKYLKVGSGKYFIDLKSILSNQLSAFKIPGENIEFSSLCTFHERDYLHSYRRDREKSGRMMAVIGMK